MAERIRNAEAIVLALLEEAAREGRPCPKNEVLCAAIGASSIATAARVVATLEGRGVITVARTRTSRTVTIVASGERTSEPLKGTRGPQRADELAELVSTDLTLAEASVEMGLSQQRVNAIWQWIRGQLGWQAV